ncbi:MAG: acylphosphatase [Pseudomonadota bacterium]
MADQDLVQVHLRITGRVQGVCYRANACEQAKAMGLRGWVRNRIDGSVEAMALGTPHNIEAFVTWCGQGPSAAQVQQVAVRQVTPVEECLPFEVRY